jgi:hypothetical protein
MAIMAIMAILAISITHLLNSQVEEAAVAAGISA